MISTFIKKVLTASLILLCTLSLTHADFFVIPVQKKIANVVTVAKSDAKYSDLSSALASITDASETNPYVIYIGPGLYTVTAPIVLKPFVNIVGSGKESTKLVASLSSTSVGSATVIYAENNVTLSNLGIENSASSDTCIGILLWQKNTKIKNVGIHVVGGENVYGIYGYQTNAVMDNVDIKVENGSNLNAAMGFLESNPIIKNSSLEATGGGYNKGVEVTKHTAVITNSTATVGQGTFSSAAVYCASQTTIYFRRSTAENTGATGSAFSSTGGIVSSQSTVIGSVVGAYCVASDNGSGDELSASCAAP